MPERSEGDSVQPSAVKMALGKLRGIRRAIERETFRVTESIVREFHSALDLLDSEGADMSGSRIPPEEVAPHVGSFVGGVPQYTRTRYCPLDLFRAKLEGVIEMFDTPDEPKFTGPRRVE